MSTRQEVRGVGEPGRLLLDLSALPLLAAGTVIKEGFTRGVNASIDYPHTGVPLLDSFYLLFTRGTSTTPPIDHQIHQIMVMPDHPESQKLTVGYHDLGKDDDYYYKIAHHTVADRRIIRAGAAQVGCVGRYTTPIQRPPGSIFVLRGFQVWFHGREHEIDEFGIVEDAGNLTVFYNDRNDDDTFNFAVDYAWLPADLVVQRGEVQGNATTGADQVITGGPSVISGFQFNFRPGSWWNPGAGDHNLRDVGVLTPDGHVRVFYADRNGDDRFDWRVRWTILR